jgi:hypothetical protein
MIPDISISAIVHGRLRMAVVAMACLEGRGDQPEIPGT